MKAVLNTFMDFATVIVLLLLAEGAIALKRMLDEKRTANRSQEHRKDH